MKHLRSVSPAFKEAHEARSQRASTDQELRMWAVEQSVKWRATTNGDTGTSSPEMAQNYYRFAKDGKAFW